MTRFFWVDEDNAVAEKYGGYVDATNRWGLPGAKCHTCGVTWSGAGHKYPCIDLSQLPEHREFVKARPEPFSEFARLRELVRPLAPPNAKLPPGTGFGPLEGTASGRFAAFVWVSGLVPLVRQETFAQLQAEGLRGLPDGVAVPPEEPTGTAGPPD